jgi:hypothetical protein
VPTRRRNLKALHDQLILSESRNEARRHNERQTTSDGILVWIEGGIDVVFPRTVNDFWGMDEATADSLIRACGLGTREGLDMKVRSLAVYCGVKLPE